MAYRYLIVFLVMVVSGFVLAGCTDNNDEKLTEVENKLEIIDNNDSDEDTEEPTDEDSDVDVEEEPEAEEPADDTVDEEMEEEEEVVVVDDEDTFVGATVADNVRVVKYNYYFENNQLVFEWTFKSDNSDKKIASYSTGYDASNNFVVTFTSVNKDYVATEEKEMVLGSKLPALRVKPVDKTSEYKFMIAKKTDSTFTIVGDMLVLKLDLN